MNSSVYFVECSGRIKIGFSRNVDGRLKALKTGAPSVLNVLAVVDGSRSFEQAIHRYLHRWRLQGEWFEDCVHVRDLMQDVVARGYAAVDFVEPVRTPLQAEFEQRISTEIMAQEAAAPFDQVWDNLNERITAMIVGTDKFFLVRKIEILSGADKGSLLRWISDSPFEKGTMKKALDFIQSAHDRFHSLYESAVKTEEEQNDFVIAQAEAIISHAEAKVQSLVMMRDMDADLALHRKRSEESIVNDNRIDEGVHDHGFDPPA